MSRLREGILAPRGGEDVKGRNEGLRRGGSGHHGPTAIH